MEAKISAKLCYMDSIQIMPKKLNNLKYVTVVLWVFINLPK